MLFKPKTNNAKKLTSNNVKKYVEDTYGSTAIQTADVYMQDFTPLLQCDFGGDNDCTLTCITAIIKHITKGKHKATSIYEYVEKIAKKHLYHHKIGTNYFVIKSIFDKALEKYCSKKSKVGHIKNKGYNLKTIVTQINKKNPVILSLHSDGNGYYGKHSVVVIGYRTYSVNNKDKTLLKIYDNWSRQIAYLDYEKISTISSVNYPS